MCCLSLGTRPVVDMTSSRSQHSVIIIIVKLTRIFLAQISYAHGTWKRELSRSLKRFGSWFVCHRNDSWGDIRMKISSRWNENLACSWPGQRDIPVKRNRLGWGKNNNWSTAKIDDDQSQERSPRNLPDRPPHETQRLNTQSQGARWSIYTSQKSINNHERNHTWSKLRKVVCTAIGSYRRS